MLLNFHLSHHLENDEAAALFTLKFDKTGNWKTSKCTGSRKSNSKRRNEIVFQARICNSLPRSFGRRGDFDLLCR